MQTYEKYGLTWKAIKVTGKPYDNRELVNLTRGHPNHAEMRQNGETAQLGFVKGGEFEFLEPGEWVAYGEDQQFHRLPVGAFEDQE